MRSRLSELSFLPLAVALTVGGLAAPAYAGGGPYHDRIYADSGDGVVYLDNDDDEIVYRECWNPAVLLKGRSYMYGLEDGELPDLPGGCHAEQRAAPGAALRRVQP